jgi:hypothetical protein
MNIFATDRDPYIAASHLERSIKHHNKMITESAQMLGTAVRYYVGSRGTLVHPKKGLIEYQWVLPGEQNSKFNVPLVTHINHPCTQWVRHNRSNWVWLWNYGRHLCTLWTNWKGKSHGAEKYYRCMGRYGLEGAIPEGNLTKFPLVTGDYSSYVDYLLGAKSQLMQCKLR